MSNVKVPKCNEMQKIEPVEISYCYMDPSKDRRVLPEVRVVSPRVPEKTSLQFCLDFGQISVGIFIDVFCVGQKFVVHLLPLKDGRHRDVRTGREVSGWITKNCRIRVIRTRDYNFHNDATYGQATRSPDGS